MSKFVVATYQDEATAAAVERELREAGNPNDSITRLDHGRADHLESFGIRGSDAAPYRAALESGAAFVAVKAEDEAVPDAQAIMNRHQPIDVESRFGRSMGRESTSSRVGDRPRHERRADDDTIEVVEEELHVGKRAVQAGGVRVVSHVTETPVEEDVTLREEHVRVERRPVNREIRPGEAAFQDQTLEATETREEAVVQKTARVIEEIVLHKEAGSRTETIRDTVRRTDVDVQQLEAGFRTDHATRFSGGQYDFDQTSPAYRFGTDLASHESYRGKSWREVESHARTRFEERNPGMWEQFKGAVEHAYTSGSTRR